MRNLQWIAFTSLFGFSLLAEEIPFQKLSALAIHNVGSQSLIELNLGSLADCTYDDDRWRICRTAESHVKIGENQFDVVEYKSYPSSDGLYYDHAFYGQYTKTINSMEFTSKFLISVHTSPKRTYGSIRLMDWNSTDLFGVIKIEK